LKEGVTYAYSDPAHLHAPTVVGNRSLRYDANGNRTGWDCVGTTCSRSATWDADNRLSTITVQNGTVQMGYNHAGSRISKGSTLYFGNYVESSPTGDSKIIPAGDTFIRKTGTQKEYYFMDHRRNVRAVTDNSGNPIGGASWAVEYDPFDQKLVWTGPPNLRHTVGVRNDEEFGLVYMNARYYDPKIGKFISADTITPGGPQGLNRYAYNFNDPVNYIDPSGHAPCIDIDSFDRVERSRRVDHNFSGGGCSGWSARCSAPPVMGSARRGGIYISFGNTGHGAWVFNDGWGGRSIHLSTATAAALGGYSGWYTGRQYDNLLTNTQQKQQQRQAQNNYYARYNMLVKAGVKITAEMSLQIWNNAHLSDDELRENARSEAGTLITHGYNVNVPGDMERMADLLYNEFGSDAGYRYLSMNANVVANQLRELFAEQFEALQRYDSLAFHQRRYQRSVDNQEIGKDIIEVTKFIGEINKDKKPNSPEPSIIAIPDLKLNNSKMLAAEEDSLNRLNRAVATQTARLDSLNSQINSILRQFRGYISITRQGNQQWIIINDLNRRR
jgi:RHS repeat-associated protein